jgi:hypothetical protein
MFEKDMFSTLRRTQEDKYFLRKDHELISKLQRRLELEAELENYVEHHMAFNKDLLRDLLDLGFTRESLSLLYLIPVVYVAWAEGFVSERERKQVFRTAFEKGIDENSVAFVQLNKWLTERPGIEFFEKVLGIVQTLFHQLSPEEEEAKKRNLIADCFKVAVASGELSELWQHISEQKKEAINQVITELNREHYKTPASTTG